MYKFGLKNSAVSADATLPMATLLDHVSANQWNGLYAALGREADRAIAPVIAPMAGPDVAPAFVEQAAVAVEPATSPVSASFTSGNVVVYRVGAVGSGVALSGVATAVFLDEYTATGTLVQSIALPTSDSGANQTLTQSGSATSGGVLTRSADGRYLVFSGYDAAPGTAGVTGTASATVNRIVGRVDGFGNVDTSTRITTAFSGDNVRGVASQDGLSFYVAGNASAAANNGIRLISLGANGGETTIANGNFRSIDIFGGQLYVDTASALSQVGVGVPTGTAPLTSLNVTLANANEFVFLDRDAGVAGIDTLYVAQDSGVAKFALIGGVWTAEGTIATGVRGLDGVVSGGAALFYGTNAAGNAIVTFTDTAAYDATIVGTVTTIATASANTAFRGLAFAPLAAESQTVSITVAPASQNEGNGGTTAYTFTVTRTGGTSGALAFTAAFAAIDTNAADFGGTLPATVNGTIAAGAASTTFTVSVTGDTTAESNETFSYTLTAATDPAVPSVVIGTATAAATILDDDATVPALTINDVSLTEGNGATTYTFTVSLSGPAGAGGVTFDIATADGTATAGSDYTARTLTAQTIAAGSSTYSFSVTVQGDALPEPNETFFVNVTNVVGATVTDAQGLGTIVNDDRAVIPAGSFSTSYAAVAGTNILVAGTTRTQTASTGVTVGNTASPVTIAIDGTLNDTATGQRAINFAADALAGSVSVGSGGLVQTLNGEAIRVQTTRNAVNLTNLGSIVATTAPFTPSVGGTNPGTAFALNYNASLGANGAGAGDYTSGGVITNGSAGVTTALIRADNGDAIRLGSHQTLVNYGTINGNGPINDAATNNVFNGANGNPNTVTDQTYDVSRSVRLNQANASAVLISNFGTITGAQHGVDVGVAGVTNLVVTNQASGSIIGRNGSGVGADTTGAADNTVTVNNYGVIRGDRSQTVTDRAGYTSLNGTGDSDGDGVDVDGAATVNNFAGGQIRGTGASGFDSGGRSNNAEGISIGGGVILNAGIVSGASFGIVVNNDSNGSGSRSGVSRTTITNALGGSVTGDAGFAIRLENKTGTAADNDTIVNFGTITGNGGVPGGTVLLQTGNADTGTVGTLDGVTYTSADAGSARFIRGDGAAIQMGEGNDSLDNYGAIVAVTSGRAINLEGGADVLTLRTGGTVGGRIDGGAGADTLVLALDDRDGTDPLKGNNAGVTVGTLRNVVNVETLSVTGGGWTLSDSQGYSAGVTSAAGSSLTITSGTTLTVGGTLALAGALVDDGAFVLNGFGAVTGTISGSGGVTKAGTGTFTLAAGNSYAGGTLLSGGTLELTALGAAGTGAITFAAGAQTLALANAALGADAAHTFGNVLAGFGDDGDVLAFNGVAIGTASARYDATTGVLTLVAKAGGATLATVTVGTGFGADAIALRDSGTGGTAVSFVAAVGGFYNGGAGDDTITTPNTPSRVDVSQGGNDTVTGGTANDAIFAGAALTATDRIDGGSGNDQLGLQGDYTGANRLVLGASTVTNVETIALLGAFGYDLTTAQETVAAGQALSIYGSALPAGSTLTFDGSAETDGGRFVVYGGLGTDLVTGGSGDDAIYFGRGGRFGANDVVNGGAGTDQLAFQGSFTGTIDAAHVRNVEQIVLLEDTTPTTDYTITLADDWALPGDLRAISFNTLRTGATIDGSAETSANLLFFGGAGNDTITGGGGNDTLYGAGGSDRLTGGAGADTYAYTQAGHSIGSAFDTIVGFDASIDRIDLPTGVSVTAIDPNASGAADRATLDDALTALLGNLGANHAVQFTVTGGDLASSVFEVIDANGVAGYQAVEDMVILLETGTPIVDPAVFI